MSPSFSVSKPESSFLLHSRHVKQSTWYTYNTWNSTWHAHNTKRMTAFNVSQTNSCNQNLRHTLPAAWRFSAINTCLLHLAQTSPTATAESLPVTSAGVMYAWATAGMLLHGVIPCCTHTYTNQTERSLKQHPTSTINNWFLGAGTAKTINIKCLQMVHCENLGHIKFYSVLTACIREVKLQIRNLWQWN